MISRPEGVIARRRAARPVLWRQVAIGLALFGVYLVVNSLPGGAAERNGRSLYAFEQALSLDIEQPANSWLARRGVLATIANYEYAFGYVVGALIAFVWLYLRHPKAFARARDSFVLLNLLGIVCFALYPVTPPRLLDGLGFVDTVRRGRTWGSWGSGMVDHANQHAAMPSLHVAWVLWVSVVLAAVGARRWVQVLGGAHVAITVAVIVCTANHYVLDAVGGVVLVVVAVPVANAWHDHRERRAAVGPVVPPSDEFFLHVERPTAAQHVGGMVIFDRTDGAGDVPSLARVREIVAGELVRMPRFRQRLSDPERWRRPRWTDAGELDWDWHVSERRSGDGVAGLHRVVAELAENPLPRDRPLWRLVVVRDVDARSALVIVMHHTVADGIGTILHTLNLMRPRVGLPIDGLPQPGPLRRAAATAVGLGQLAAGGRMGGRLDTGSPRRAYATAAIELDRVRRGCAELGTRFTDLLLALVGEAVASTHPDLAKQVRGRLRVAVSLMARSPGDAAEGNSTAGVMIDVPIDGRPFGDLLTAIGSRTTRLRSPTRPLAARFVMANGLRALPEPSAGWFARTVYGRRFFHAIVSNLVGPTEQLSIGDVPLEQVYPILPLAPGVPLALGAMSWHGVLGIGLATDPETLDADALAARVTDIAATVLP
jgi:PAP2 superfamily protein/wax ester synthase-like acyl-CoA acyltransferase family protein/uncharacterized protein DUF1298